LPQPGHTVNGPVTVVRIAWSSDERGITSKVGFHDRQEFGTAESTDSFVVMENRVAAPGWRVDRDVRGLEDLVYGGGELVLDRREVDRLAPPARERGHGRLRVVVSAVEPPVHGPLDPPAQRVEHCGRGQRTTEVVYRRELRPVITTGAQVMDQIFPAG
jgi:hypothetical protein